MIPDKLESRIGKYSNNVEAAIHEAAMDEGGFGDVETFGFFSLVVFNAEERAALAKLDGYDNVAAAIVKEDSQGFVHLSYFEHDYDAIREYESAEAEWGDPESEAEAEGGDGWSPADAWKAGE